MLGQWFKEALRLNSPAAGIFNRVALQDVKIKDITIRKGDIVSWQFGGLLFDDKYFPDHNNFKIDRFSDENKKQIPQFSYIPFSIGKRTCAGRYMGELTTKLLVLSLCRQFDIARPSDIAGYYNEYKILNTMEVTDVLVKLRPQAPISR